MVGLDRDLGDDEDDDDEDDEDDVGDWSNGWLGCTAVGGLFSGWAGRVEANSALAPGLGLGPEPTLGRLVVSISSPVSIPVPVPWLVVAVSLLVVSMVLVVVSPSVAAASIVLKGSLSRMFEANERLVDMGEIKLSLGPEANCCG